MNTPPQHKIGAGEAKFRNLVFQAPVAMSVLTGTDFSIEIVNKKQLEIWQKEEAEVLHKPFFDVFPEAKSPDFERLLTEVYVTGIPFIAKEVPSKLYRNGSLETAYFDFTYEPMRNELGDVEGIIVLSTEVTENVNGRKLVEESEKRFKLAIKASGQIVFTQDENLNYTWIYNEIPDFKAEGVLGKDDSELNEPETAKRLIALKKKVLQSGIGIKSTVLMNTKGEQSYYEIMIEPIKNERGKVTGIMGVLMNTTGKVATDKQIEAIEKRLEQERKSLHDFFTQAPAVLAILKGPEHVFEFANPSYVELTGNRNIINKTLLEALPELAGQGLIELLDNVYKTGEAFTGKEIPVMLDKRNGKPESIFMNFTYQAFTNDNGETEGILVFAYDVSEQVNARKRIEESETSMRQLASHLKLATDSANVGTWLLNIQTQKLEWSALHKKMWGYDEHHTDLTYEDWHKAILPEDKEKASEKVEEARVHHTLYEADYYIKRADDGAVRYMRSYGKYHYNDKGEAETLTGISIDVSDQKEAELKLKASEEKYRGLFETMDQGFCIIKLIFDSANKPVDYLFIEANPMFEKHGGIGNPVGKTIRELVPNIEERWFETYGKVALTGKANHFIEHSEELNRWFEVYAFSLGDQGSKNVAVLFTDITERKLAEEKIKENETQFRVFADSIQNLAWIANDDGSIYWYNKQWYDYTGTTLEEMEGFGWQKVHHPDHVKNIIEVTTELWKRDEPFELTFPLRRHDGEYRWFLTRAYPIKAVNGNIDRWIGTNTDITEQKGFSEELEDKVKERTQELNEKNLQLERTNAELSSFTYVASHDLQEPLRKIQLFSKHIVEAEKFSIETQNNFNRIIAAGERMQNLIISLLNFSRISSTDLFFKPCDLNAIVEESKDDLQLSIIEKQAVVEYKNLPTINGSHIQLSQLFTNLIDNAIKYSRPEFKPHINISASIVEGKEIEHPSANQKEYHTIKIADNGIGFKNEYANKIFEIFQRLHGKNEYSGTGIGLAIVKKIVTNHNGFIVAEGELNMGSRFTIYIPTA